MVCAFWIGPRGVVGGLGHYGAHLAALGRVVMSFTDSGMDASCGSLATSSKSRPLVAGHHVPVGAAHKAARLSTPAAADTAAAAAAAAAAADNDNDNDNDDDDDDDDNVLHDFHVVFPPLLTSSPTATPTATCQSRGY